MSVFVLRMIPVRDNPGGLFYDDSGFFAGYRHLFIFVRQFLTRSILGDVKLIVQLNAFRASSYVYRFAIILGKWELCSGLALGFLQVSGVYLPPFSDAQTLVGEAARHAARPKSWATAHSINRRFHAPDLVRPISPCSVI
ncbi:MULTISPECIES: hypothetical protein [unclassified Yoonia]|uniref:hypothetical protein n=1 Tax=unclassified Yoonia TaxID=2629118 RepID=UPI002AFE10DD|nr:MULTISPECIES: hypothetical protein [unclassified Yoonia]